MRVNHYLLIAIFLLIISKLLTIFHLNLTETLYLDIDRLFSLIVFLVAYHSWSQEKFSIKPYLLLIISGLLISLLAILFSIPFNKMLILFFLTAFVEEILLRGVLFELLLTKLKPVVIVISTSLFFTLVHPAIYSSLLYAFAVLLTGLILGASYLYFRKQGRALAIVYTTILHSLIILLGLKLGLI